MKCDYTGPNTKGENKYPRHIDVQLGRFWEQIGFETLVVLTAERRCPGNQYGSILCLNSTAARLKLKRFGGTRDLPRRV